MFKLIMPWNNLGCLGIRLGRKSDPWLYADLYVKGPWYRIGWYLHRGYWKLWGQLTPLPKVFKIEDWRNNDLRVWRNNGRGWRRC